MTFVYKTLINSFVHLCIRLHTRAGRAKKCNTISHLFMVQQKTEMLSRKDYWPTILELNSIWDEFLLTFYSCLLLQWETRVLKSLHPSGGIDVFGRKRSMMGNAFVFKIFCRVLLFWWGFQWINIHPPGFHHVWMEKEPGVMAELCFVSQRKTPQFCPNSELQFKLFFLALWLPG